MKTYKTWEVIKMITENPNLKFKNKNSDTRYTKIIKCSKNGYIAMDNTSRNNQIIGNIMFNEEWMLIQEPVSFIEAIESGKKIKVEHELTKCLCISEDYYSVHNILYILGSVLKDINIRAVLREGKFYIEE